MVDIPAQGDLPVVEVLEGGVAQQLERHPVGLRARVVDEGCDSPGLESECKLMGWNPNENYWLCFPGAEGGQHILRDKMNCTVRFGNSFLTVSLVYQTCCLLP